MGGGEGHEHQNGPTPLAPLQGYWNGNSLRMFRETMSLFNKGGGDKIETYF